MYQVCPLPIQQPINIPAKMVAKFKPGTEFAEAVAAGDAKKKKK